MLIGIVSDSHDHLTYLETALQRFDREKVEGVIHPGDMVAPFAAKLLKSNCSQPLRVVYGNNDGERKGLAAVLDGIVDGPILVEWGGRRISVDHYPPDSIHRPYPDCEIVIFGHTHQVLVEKSSQGLWINPGECCGWVTGNPTVALLDTDSLKVDVLSLK